MTYARDLLDVARGLARLDEEPPRQASLRRAVSTAYYALFHLLISESTSNWRRPELRSRLGRAYEHSVMKAASGRLISELDKSSAGADSDDSIRTHLSFVARMFLKVNQSREQADYDTAFEWTRTDVLDLVNAVSQAFESWELVREDPRAQKYLVSLLLKKEH